MYAKSSFHYKRFISSSRYKKEFSACETLLILKNGRIYKQKKMKKYTSNKIIQRKRKCHNWGNVF